MEGVAGKDAAACPGALAPGAGYMSVDRQNQTHAATHNICGLCVPRRRCPVVPLSGLKRESELPALSCFLTRRVRITVRSRRFKGIIYTLYKHIHTYLSLYVSIYIYRRTHTHARTHIHRGKARLRALAHLRRKWNNGTFQRTQVTHTHTHTHMRARA